MNIIREYGANPDSKDFEHASLKAIGWPTDYSYHPRDHIEKLCFAFHFVPYNNEQVNKVYMESFKYHALTPDLFCTYHHSIIKSYINQKDRSPDKKERESK